MPAFMKSPRGVPLDDATTQELFDCALAGVRRQGGPSVTVVQGKTVCAYRGDNDRRCVIGHLIPDDAYSPAMEGLIATALAWRAGGPFIGLPAYLDAKTPQGRRFILMRRLQTAHDRAWHATKDQGDAAFMATFERRMRRLASDFGLLYDKPTT